VEDKKPLPSRIIAIDYGQVRIGLALSDATKVIAFPLTLAYAEKSTEATAKKLLKLLEEHAKTNQYSIAEIVVGLPLLMSGKSGLQADEVRYFVSVLQQWTSIPVKTWDERLTTVQAERSLREGALSRKQRAKVVDTASAVILLQSYLDSRAPVI